ncbi:ribosome small subunit-dependent GTPase A [Rubellicoccus peritrichatus]|uniref:Small ribosomal subunit biogenesis GTPase RsgA n=1 Tax=Rubellicoccus peritrichatus TaxID=3080537 RepID=A0AAQ3L666_9BACT|nr:ribosome small subunit-dependent GTPase A [Puniceicoccus sp. CR14]WOO39666.1 ribosome small subunit-dependent GTPase A [Puniceicoccus sp. CR14]
MTLYDLGWNARFEAEFADCLSKGWQPARLVRDNKISYGARLGDGAEMEVALGGAVYHEAATDAELPAVGDWVALEIGDDGNEYDAVIRARLTRQTCLSRKAPGKSTEEQVLAANVDVVFVITEAGQDFNLRRMERYFAILQRSGARSVVLLNKSDLYSDEENQVAKAKLCDLNPNVEVHITSALESAGVDVLRSYLKSGVTIALIGSSGVGKSSLINQLLGQEFLWTGEVNGVTGKGMHTTTARELILLPGGGMLIDNPGIREVQMWTDAKTLKESFSDFDHIARDCLFHNCKHGSDRGCAIQAALKAGTLSKERFANYLKLDEELEKLRKRRKKRQLTISRRIRRELKSKGEKYSRKYDVD